MKKFAVFVCLTSSQLFISCSYAQELEKENIYSYIIYKGRHLPLKGSDFASFKIIQIPFSNLREKAAAKILYGYLFKQSSLFQYVSISPDFYFFNEKETITKRFLECCLDRKIMVEEGIGEYLRNDPFGIDRRITGACVGFPDLFQKSHPEWRGEIQLFDYKRIFNEIKSKWFANLINSQREEIRTEYVYIGQPLEGFSQDEEKVFLDTIFRAFAEYGICISIKPHPREENQKYDFLCRKYRNVILLSQLSGYIPLECLCLLYNVQYLYTFYSSAGINAAFIDQNIKTTFLCYIREFKTMKAVEIISGETEFEELLSRAGILIPNSMGEFAEMVKKQIKE